MPRPSRAKVRRIFIGVCGSIAAYKACLVVRALARAGCEVRVAMTANAQKFVGPMTLAALAKSPVVTDLMDPAQWDMAHLSLASWADRALVVPATADMLARLTGYGYHLLGPVSGPLASGRVGMGRLLDPEEIVRRTLA